MDPVRRSSVKKPSHVSYGLDQSVRLCLLIAPTVARNSMSSLVCNRHLKTTLVGIISLEVLGGRVTWLPNALCMLVDSRSEAKHRRIYVGNLEQNTLPFLDLKQIMSLKRMRLL